MIYLLENDEALARLRRLVDADYELTRPDARRLFEANDSCLRLLYETHQSIKKSLRPESP